MRSELEKFAIYVGKNNLATLVDVHATIQDAGAAELDDLIFAVGGGEPKRAAQLMDHLFAEQISPVALLRAAQRHFIRLQWARAQMDGGSTKVRWQASCAAGRRLALNKLYVVYMMQKPPSSEREPQIQHCVRRFCWV
jgi:DNA polymerase III delta subunit